MQRAHLSEVVVVNMRVDAEQAAQNSLDAVHKVWRERSPRRDGEEGFVIDLRLSPVEQTLNIVRCTQTRRPAETRRVRVLPVVLKAGTCTHNRALTSSTELRDCTVEDVQVVEEVNCVDSKPFLKDLALREADGDAQVAAA